MKKYALLAAILLGLGMTACSEVPAGNVGVKVFMLGSSKGVDHEVLPVGRYWIGWNEKLFTFPIFQQNYTWTKNPHEGSPNDESITFQTKEGMDVNADVGISYHLNPDKIATIFQKYRKPIDEITDVYLRNAVRDAVVKLGSNLSVEQVYGTGKGQLFADAKTMVKTQMDAEGIVIDNLYLVGSPRLPDNVVHALNSKIEATQRAQQRENEVAEAEAQANKEVATANGHAKAVLAQAKAEAQANELKLHSVTDALIRYEAVQKWSGQLPQMMGGNTVPFINLDRVK